MRKLLSSHIARLRKSNLLWLCLLLVFLTSWVAMRVGTESMAAPSGYDRAYLDWYFFRFSAYLGLFQIAAIGLFLGQEYGDGTFRNKLIIGHSRPGIYLSGFLACELISIVLMVAWLIGTLVGSMQNPFDPSNWEISLGELWYYILAAFIFTTAFAALLTWIGTIADNKALSVVLMFGIWLTMQFAASQIYSRLGEAEFEGEMVYINGVATVVNPTPNPLYLSGTIRIVCACVLYFLPNGLVFAVSDANIEYPMFALVFGGLFALLTLASGCVIFCKKSIK
ncbi:MAG: ABC transporter permease [Oscillospiraceae bacterium]|nr:ABC transporter permease [Oscillospiraceae bacterium]